MHRKLTLAIVITLIAGLVLPFPALAAKSYTLKGYGYGHGIGLCQWGARGRAVAGQTYDQILTHYFQGTTITRNYQVPSTVRVRLFGNSNITKAYVEGYTSSTLDFVKTDGTYAYQGAVGKHLVAPNAKGLLKIIKPNGTVAADDIAGPVIVSNATASTIVYDAAGKRKHTYEGSIYIYPNSATSLYLVNYVAFEPDYLNGLGEVPSSWSYDALYAQAIAARTYAIKCMKPQSTFDLYDDTRSQVYVGLDKINEVSGGKNWGARWAKAVADTSAQVITYGGQPIAAYYHSSCGGHTENVELAWTKSSAQPYLKGVSDINSAGQPYCGYSGNSSFSWTANIAVGDFEKKLGVTGISGVEITKKGTSPRIVSLKINKSSGSAVTMSGQDFRSKLGVKSAWVYQIGGTFPDVPLSFWAFSQIEYLSDKGIVQGYSAGSFNPSGIVTRAQLVKMLAIALGIPKGGKSGFNDTQGHWAEPYIAALDARNVVGGYEDGAFRPDVMITRAEICTIIARVKSLTKGSKSVSFSDTQGHWAKDAIDTVASRGIVTGYSDGTFKPNTGATRAEVSVMLYRMLGAGQ